MDNIYFEKLANSINESSTIDTIVNKNVSFLVVHVDIDCRLYCDGELLGNLEADKVEKISIPVGEHTITVESEKCDEVKEFVDMDILEAGKNYRLPIQYLREREQNVLLEQGRIKKKEEEYESQLKQRSVEIKNANKKIARLEAEMSDMEKQFEIEATAFQEKLNGFIEKVKKQRDAENKASEQEKNQLTKKHSDEIKELKDVVTAKELKIKELNKEISERVPRAEHQAVIEQYNDKISALEENNEKVQKQVVRDANKQLEAIRKQIVNDANREIERVKKTLNEEIAKLKSQISSKDRIINEMKNRGFSEKFKDLFK